MLELGINHVTNTEYHADQKYLSSSNYKTLLKDPETFYKEKILGQKEARVESNSFTEGSLTHSLILEPDQVQHEYAFFEGMRKAGADYERFLAANTDRTVISRPQRIRSENNKAAFLKNPQAVELLSGGFPEQTICVDLNGIPTKIRCDYINVEKGYIADVKTTSYPADVDTFRMTISQWSYDLSAALYAHVAEQYYGKKFDFYFVVIQKSDLVCEVYKASQATIDRGMLQIAKAATIYKQCLQTGIWKLDQPAPHVSGEILEV